MSSDRKALKKMLGEIEEGLTESPWGAKDWGRILLSYSDKEIKEIVSDKYWNRYPMYISQYYGEERSVHPKPYGQVMRKVVSDSCQFSKRGRRLLSKHSVGLLQAYTIDATRGSSRAVACNRAYKSKDVRVRKRAARYISIKRAKPFLSDSDAGVKDIIIKRIGPDHCFDAFMEDPCFWIRSEAISSSNISSSEASRLFLKYKEENTNQYQYYRERVLCSLLSKIDIGEILYLLGDSDIDSTVSNHIRKRIEYHNLQGS